MGETVIYFGFPRSRPSNAKLMREVSLGNTGGGGERARKEKAVYKGHIINKLPLWVTAAQSHRELWKLSRTRALELSPQRDAGGVLGYLLTNSSHWLRASRSNS